MRLWPNLASVRRRSFPGSPLLRGRPLRSISTRKPAKPEAAVESPRLGLPARTGATSLSSARSQTTARILPRWLRQPTASGHSLLDCSQSFALGTRLTFFYRGYIAVWRQIQVFVSSIATISRRCDAVVSWFATSLQRPTVDGQAKPTRNARLQCSRNCVMGETTESLARPLRTMGIQQLEG